MLFENASVTLLMKVPPSVSCNGCYVFVSASGQADDDGVFRIKFFCDLHRMGYCMGTLDRTDDTLGSCEVFKSFYCLIVRYRNVFGAADVMQICMLRSNAR